MNGDGLSGGGARGKKDVVVPVKNNTFTIARCAKSFPLIISVFIVNYNMQI